MKRNSHQEKSSQKSNQVVKDLQNDNEEEFIACNEINEDNKTNEENKTKNNNDHITYRQSADFRCIRNELDCFRKNFLELENNVHNLGIDSHGLRSNIHELSNDVHGLSNDVHVLRDDDHELSNDVHGLRFDFHELRNDIHDLGNTFHNLLNRMYVLDLYRLYYNGNSNIDEGQNNEINYDELLDEIELDEKSFEKYKEEKCVICLEDFNAGNKVCYLPCLHLYHSFCIKNWLKIRVRCPLCGDDLNNNNNNS